MESLQGKKLLILGGSSYMIDPVLQAKQMGIYTIVTDLHGIEKAPAKRIADEYWDISLMAYDQLVPKIKERGVDGILTGFTDAFLLAYQHLCELTGLPCYATKEMFETTMDKSKFKQLCRDNGVPVIPEYDLASFDPSTITEKNKVIIKPVDNSGSNGVIVCNKPEEFTRCLEYALSFSAKKQVVIEKYMEMDSVSISYTIQDGIISMSTMNDRVVHKAENAGAVTNGGVYPSKYIDSYMEKMDMKVRGMYEKLGVQNGVIAIQFFTDGDEYYCMEMGYRLTGGQHYIYTSMENGTSSLESLICYALTGRMADYRIAERDNPRFKDLCFQWNILGREGKIVSVEGFEKVSALPEVVKSTLDKRAGDVIGKDGTTSQKIAGIYTIVRDKDEMMKILDFIYSTLKVLDEDGNNLVLDTVAENFK